MKDLIKSFAYAFKGITYCIANERNMRIHICFMVYMFGYLTVHDFFEVSRTQMAVLFVASAAVIAFEAVNTAVERVIDLETNKKSPLAGAAKDAAAGAVLVAAIGAVAIGIAILWQPEAFAAMFDFYKANIPVLIALALSLAASFIFIFAGPLKIRDFFRKHIK